MAATMMECFSLVPRAKVMAVASGDAQRTRAFAQRFGIPIACNIVDELLARADLDAVYIVNATRDHAATAISALAAGKAVLCEKPFAISAAQGLQVAAAAASSQRLFVEAQWTPMLPAYRALRRIADTRALGTPQYLHSEFGQSLDEASHSRLFQGEGAGVLLDFAVYPIVLALQLLGPVAAVRAGLRHNAAGTDVQAVLQLVHHAGGQSQLAASLIADLSNTSALSCSHGLVQLDSPVVGTESLRIRQTAPRQGHRPAPALPLRASMIGRLRQVPWVRRARSWFQQRGQHAYQYGANRYLPQLQHFIALLDAGAQESDLMPLETSLDVLRVIDRARADSYPLDLPASQ